MAFSIPTLQQTLNTIRSSVTAELGITIEQIDSLLDSIIKAEAFISDDLYKKIQEALDALLITRATGSDLEELGTIWEITRNPATKASGNISITGVATTNVPIGTIFLGGAGNTYTTKTATTIQALSITPASITSTGTTATVTFSSSHFLNNNIQVIIAGANETDYNGTFNITVLSDTTFSYTIANPTTSPATGTITVDYTVANVEIESEETGQDKNLGFGTQVTLQTPIVNVDSNSFVQFNGITGGTDIETDTSLRNRLLDKVQGTLAPFNAKNIELKAKEVSGVTRVFVQEADLTVVEEPIDTLDNDVNGIVIVGLQNSLSLYFDGSPINIRGASNAKFNVRTIGVISQVDDTKVIYTINDTTPTSLSGTNIATFEYAPNRPGTVTVYFTRDDDTDPIPDAGEIQDVKDKLDTIRPANMAESFLRILAPTRVDIGFTFTALSPNTAEMQSLIRSQLQSFFEDTAEMGRDILEAEYNSAILNTVDSQGSTPTFTLSSPTGDITINDGELAFYDDGATTFP